MPRSRTIRLAVFSAAGVLACACLVLCALHTSAAKRFALEQAVRLLSEQGIGLQASRLDYNLLRQTVDLRDVRVRSLDASGLPPLIAVDHLSAKFDLRGILASAYHLNDASVDNLHVHLVIAADGRDNVHKLRPKTTTSKPMDYLIRRLLVSGGEFRFDDRRRQVSAIAVLETIAVSGDPLSRKHQASVRTRDGSRITRAGRDLPVNGLAADLTFDDPRLDLRIRAGLSLASLGEFASMAAQSSGSIALEITAAGTLPDVRATAHIRGDNLAINQFDRMRLDAIAAFDSSTAVARLVSAEVSSPWARFELRGEADLGPTSRGGRGGFAIRDVDLARVSSLLGSTTKLAATASAEGEFRWPGLRFEEASGTASIRMRASRKSPTRYSLPVDGAAHAVLGDRRLTVHVDQIRTAGADIAGDVELIGGSSLDGKLSAQIPLLSTSLAAVEAFLGKEKGSLIGTAFEGSLSATAGLSGTLQTPAAAINLAVTDLAAGEVHGAAIEVAANCTPADISIDRAIVRWREQSASARGTIGLGAGRPVRLTAQATDVSLAAVLAGLNRGDLPLTGGVNLSAEVNGTLDSPNGTIVVSGQEITAYGQPFGQLAARARLKDGQVEVSDVRLSGGALQASAEYGLGTGRYQLRAQARDFALTALTLPDGTPVRGVIQLDAASRGTLDDPSGTLKLTAQNVQIGSQDFGRLDAAATLENQHAQLEISAPRFGLTSSVKSGIRHPYPATGQVRITQLDLAKLLLKQDTQLSGTVSAVIDVSGDLANYEKGAARAEVSQFDAQWNGEPVRSDAPLLARYSAGVLTLEKAAVTAVGSRIEAEGTLPIEATGGNGAVHINARVDLPGIARLLPEARFDLQGTASITGEVRGSLNHLDPVLTVEIESPKIAWPGLKPDISSARLKGQIRDGALEIESASASWLQASVTASGIVPFALLPADLPVNLVRRSGPAHLTADLKGLNLATLEGAPETLAGTVRAHLEAETLKPDLEAIRAIVSFPELQATLGSYSIAQDGVSEIALEGGIVSVRRLRLTGPTTAVTLSGTAQLAEAHALDLRLDGKLDASIATAFTDAFRARGATEVQATVAGSLEKPAVKGYVQIADGQFSIQDPRIAIEELNLRVNLEGDRATIARLDGQMNGGALSGKGSIAFSDGALKDSDLSVQARDVYLDYPAGLKTVSDVRLQLKSLEHFLALRGVVLIKEGGFTDDLNFDKGILAAATARRSLDLATERNPFLDSMRFNVSIVTQDPIDVRNNLAKAAISAQLVLLGSPYEPGLAGRLIIEDGSELTLQERRYQVSRGIVTFTSERSIEPSLDIEADTSVSNYEITLRISGTPGDTKTELTSDPVLPEPDILAILVTGKTLDEIRGQEFQVAQTQVLSYLTGRVGSTIGRQVERATGLSRVRIEPNLIAAETTPSARLTVGQEFTRQLQLVYSMDLVDSSDQIWGVEYDLNRRFSSRATRQSDGSFRFDFHHDLRFGGDAPRQYPSARKTIRIGHVELSGHPWFPESRVLGTLKVHPGDHYDVFKVRKGLDRATRLYTGAGFIESNVRLRREQTEQLVNLNLRVEAGPRLDFSFEGAAVPGRVQKQVRRTWANGVFDAQRSEDAGGVLRSWLIGDRYLQSQVQPRISSVAPDQKNVLFEIERGPRYERIEWAFEGARGIEPKRLREVIKGQNLSVEVHTKSSRVSGVLTEFYREMGYLDAAVGEPHEDLDPAAGTARIVFPVSEGPLYRVGSAHYEGNRALKDADLAEAAPLPEGETFRPVLRENALQRLREVYWERGYNDVVLDVEARRVPEQGLVNLNFRIVENARGVVSEIVVEGNRRIGEGLIRSQLQLKAGDPVNLQKIGESRRRLYNMGGFSAVDIAREDLSANEADSGADRPIRLRVKVQEVQPLELRYGAYYDTERGPGGIVDITNRNFLGGARVLGLRARYDFNLHEARLNYSDPLFARLPVKTVIGTYIRRELNPETDLATGFNVDRVGLFAQQEASIGRHMILNYGYKIEQSHTYDTGPDPIFDVRLRIASLTATLTRDTRDDLLDASRGSFLSHAVQLSPESLGSQVRFVKYFGQYFHYFPLQKPRLEMFTNQVLRPRLVYATAIRVGLGTGLGGQEIPLSERFFAGGSTTIRGFAQNSVGPETGGTVLPGGEGMLVLNNELRFPVVKMFDGVGFVDVGNVYPKVSDFSFSNLRSAAGLGVRVRTPWFLLRLDYGFKLDRRPGESVGRLFFSIGQAF